MTIHSFINDLNTPIPLYLVFFTFILGFIMRRHL